MPNEVHAPPGVSYVIPVLNEVAYIETAVRTVLEQDYSGPTELILALGPSLIGWSLMEILARSLFALDRPWPPVIAALIPVVINAAITLRVGPLHPEYLGLGASVGLISGFAVLFAVAHTGRKRWLEQG